MLGSSSFALRGDDVRVLERTARLGKTLQRRCAVRLPLAKPLPPSLWLLLITIGAIAAFFAATLYANSTASKIDSMAGDIAENADPSIRYLASARTMLHEIGADLTASVLDGDAGTGLRRDIDADEQRMHADLDAYAALPFFPTERGRWQVADLDLREVATQTNALVAQVEAGHYEEAAALREGAVAQAFQRADVSLDGLIAFDTDQASRLGASITAARHRAQRVSYALDGLAALLALSLGAGAIVSTRRHMRSIREAREADQRFAIRLTSVVQAAVSISESLGRSGGLLDMLQTAVERARSIANADIAALGMGRNPSQGFDPFVFDGIDPGTLDRLGAPRARGILGIPIPHRRTLRIDDVRKDPRFLGMPDRHPPVGPFLGVAVREDHEAVGHLYLGRKPGAPPFSDEDVGVVELLGEFVSSALQNASLYGSLRAEVKAREDIVSMVSHDLRNPLSAMSMAAAVAQRAVGTEAPVRRQIEMITRNAGRMDRMIGELLTAAKLHEGKLSVEPKAQDAGSLVRETVETFAAAASSRRVDLECNVDDEVPLVYCDGPRIGQVLSNLIGNALKFTPEGGSILVSVARSSSSEREVCFSVKDTGAGIPADLLPHVFERYWQKKEHASRGTGLGLFISKGLVEAHRGRIWVTSRPGEGSDFQFTLPAADERPAAVAAPAAH